MALHSRTLTWKIQWTQEPGRLQSMGSRRVRRNRGTSLSLFTPMHWRRKWQPTPVFLLGESPRRRSLVGCRLWGRTESDTTEVTQQQQQGFIYSIEGSTDHNLYVKKLLKIWMSEGRETSERMAVSKAPTEQQIVSVSTNHTENCTETSLEIQRLTLRASTAGGVGLIPGCRAKIPQAARCRE